MTMELDPLADRCARAARAAIAPALCDVAIVAREPLTVDIRDVPGQPPLTPAQRTAARNAALAVDRRPRRVKPLATIQAEVAAWLDDLPLSPQKVRQGLALALALLAQKQPTALRQGGVPVDGDEAVG